MRFLRSTKPRNSVGRPEVIVVVGRASAGLQKLFGKDCLPVIMASSRVAVLIMLWAHYQNHDGGDITIGIASQNAWIVKGTKLETSITKTVSGVGTYTS